MRVLVSSNLTEEKLRLASVCLKTFVEFILNIYNESFMSNNVHSVQHLPEDVKRHGPLENCSAFAYENNMPLFKHNIRKHPVKTMFLEKRD